MDTDKAHFYIGETERKHKDGICEQLGFINTTNVTQPERHHFNLPAEPT